MINLKKLQNGSDIRGVAMEGVPGESVNLDETTTKLIAKGFVKWLCDESHKEIKELKISVGHDSRISAERFKSALITSLAASGVTVIDCGLASTPAMFMSTVFPEFLCDGAIMITASHLPYNRNGFKFFSPVGGLDKKDITAILAHAQWLTESRSTDQAAHATDPAGSVREIEGKDTQIKAVDLISVYSAFLREKIKNEVNHPTDHDQPLTGLNIVVDAGNGAGGFYVDKVLVPLGACCNGSQLLEPDGMFPTHIPNPEDQEAMKSICQAVVTNKADFGLIFDTDVDRSSAVDRYGHEINRNSIVALAAALVAESHPGTTIVTDSVTSDELSVFIEQHLGCVHHRFKRGYKNVINEAIRINQGGGDCQLAIETSGHAALKENYFLDDGAYLATKIVIKAAQLALANKTLDSLLAELKYPQESAELRLAIKADDFSAYGDHVISEVELFAHVGPGMMAVIPNYEGVRISFDRDHGNGWCLLRKSLHDPLMPVNIESNDNGGCKQIAKTLFDFIEQFDQLDLERLRTFCQN